MAKPLYMQKGLTKEEFRQCGPMLKALDEEHLIEAALEAPINDIRYAAVCLLEDQEKHPF